MKCPSYYFLLGIGYCIFMYLFLNTPKQMGWPFKFPFLPPERMLVSKVALCSEQKTCFEVHRHEDVPRCLMFCWTSSLSDEKQECVFFVWLVAKGKNRSLKKNRKEKRDLIKEVKGEENMEFLQMLLMSSWWIAISTPEFFETVIHKQDTVGTFFFDVHTCSSHQAHHEQLQSSIIDISSKKSKPTKLCPLIR